MYNGEGGGHGPYGAIDVAARRPTGPRRLVQENIV